MAFGMLFLLFGISVLLTGARSLSMSKYKDRNCPDGWTKFEDRCYIFQNDSRSFLDAEKACNNLSGNLVSIHNDLENTLAVQLSLEANTTSPLIWIGLHDAVEEGDFIWTDGSCNNFQNFAQGQPDDDNGNEDCVQIQTSDALWSDGVCTDENPSVCVRDLYTPHETPAPTTSTTITTPANPPPQPSP